MSISSVLKWTAIPITVNDDDDTILKYHSPRLMTLNGIVGGSSNEYGVNAIQILSTSGINNLLLIHFTNCQIQILYGSVHVIIIRIFFVFITIRVCHEHMLTEIGSAFVKPKILQNNVNSLFVMRLYLNVISNSGLSGFRKTKVTIKNVCE